jgi:hypothetical protein
MNIDNFGFRRGEVVTFQAGDGLVQQGTDHSWINRGSRPARIAVVLVDAKPKKREP